MLMNTLRRGLTATVLCVGATIVWGSLSGSAARPLERYEADAIKTGFPGPVGSAIVDMTIERWSTDAERDRLKSVLIEENQDKLLDALTRLPRVGYIYMPGGLGYDLHYARKTTADDGSTKVYLATNRNISFWEATNQPRSIQYPFTLIEMRIGPDGKGEGKLSVATKIMYDRKQKEAMLEEYESQPVMLTNVRRQDVGKKSKRGL